MAKRKYTKKSKSKMSSYKDGSKGYIRNQDDKSQSNPDLQSLISAASGQGVVFNDLLNDYGVTATRYYDRNPNVDRYSKAANWVILTDRNGDEVVLKPEGGNRGTSLNVTPEIESFLGESVSAGKVPSEPGFLERLTERRNQQGTGGQGAAAGAAIQPSGANTLPEDAVGVEVTDAGAFYIDRNRNIIGEVGNSSDDDKYIGKFREYDELGRGGVGTLPEATITQDLVNTVNETRAYLDAYGTSKGSSGSSGSRGSSGSSGSGAGSSGSGAGSSGSGAGSSGSGAGSSTPQEVPGTVGPAIGGNLTSTRDPETGEITTNSQDILDRLNMADEQAAAEQAMAEQAQLGMPNVAFLKERRARRGNRFGAGNFIPVNQLIAEQQAQIARGETPTFDEDATYYTNLRQSRAMGLNPRKAARFMRRNFGYTPVNQGNMQAPGFFGALLTGMPTVGTGNLAYQQGLRGGRGLAVGSALGALQNIAQGFAAAAPGMGGTSPTTEANTQALNAAMAVDMANATGGQGAAAGRAAGAAGAAGRAAAQPSGRTMGEILLPGGIPDGAGEGAAAAAGMMAPTGEQIMNMSRAQRNQLARDQGFGNYRQMARGTVIPTDGAFTFPGSVARDIRSTQRFNREPLTPRRELIAQQVAQQMAQTSAPQPSNGGSLEGRREYSEEQINQANDMGFSKDGYTRKMDAGRMKGSPVPQYGVTINELKNYAGSFMDSALGAAASYANGGAMGATGGHLPFPSEPVEERKLVDLNTLRTKGYIDEDGRYIAPDPRLSDQMDFLDYLREAAIVSKNELGKSVTGVYEGAKSLLGLEQNGGYTRNMDAVAPVLTIQNEVAPLMGGPSSTGSASTARELASQFGGTSQDTTGIVQTLQSAAGTRQMTGGMGQGIAKLLGNGDSADKSTIMKALVAAAQRKQNGGYSRNQDVPDTKILGDDLSAVNAAKRLYYDMLAGEGAQSNQAGQALRMMFSPVSGLAEGIASAIYPLLSEEQQKKDDAAKGRQAQATQDLEEYKQSLKEQGKYKTPFETVKGFFGLEQNGGYSRNKDGEMKPYSEYTGSLSKEAYEARGRAMGNMSVAQGGLTMSQNESALDAAIRQQAALAAAVNAQEVTNREDRFQGMLNQMPMMMGLDAGMYTSLVPLEVNTQAVNDMNRMV